jgi:hypothetical protein
MGEAKDGADMNPHCAVVAAKCRVCDEPRNQDVDEHREVGAGDGVRISIECRGEHTRCEPEKRLWRRRERAQLSGRARPRRARTYADAQTQRSEPSMVETVTSKSEYSLRVSPDLGREGRNTVGEGKSRDGQRRVHVIDLFEQKRSCSREEHGGHGDVDSYSPDCWEVYR